MVKPKKTIRFSYEEEKALHAVLWFLHKHGVMDKLKIIKLMFYADREHLKRYGRPIVGGNYFAMPHGPVSSELLDYIKQIDSQENAPFNLNGISITPKQLVNEDYLSESDIEVLEKIDSEYGKYDSITLRKMTHQLKAYKKNKPPQGGRKELPYEDFFLDLTDDSMLEIIREDQEAMADIE